MPRAPAPRACRRRPALRPPHPRGRRTPRTSHGARAARANLKVRTTRPPWLVSTRATPRTPTRARRLGPNATRASYPPLGRDQLSSTRPSCRCPCPWSPPCPCPCPSPQRWPARWLTSRSCAGHQGCPRSCRRRPASCPAARRRPRRPSPLPPFRPWRHPPNRHRPPPPRPGPPRPRCRHHRSRRRRTRGRLRTAVLQSPRP
mmetsp:Transcript_47150/g.143327  ORF Transcript_47150/g.143327 Transcript_47150/m.143327 type:complete len:202 (-) Transcript_47150:226-831(-)